MRCTCTKTRERARARHTAICYFRLSFSILFVDSTQVSGFETTQHAPHAHRRIFILWFCYSNSFDWTYKLRLCWKCFNNQTKSLVEKTNTPRPSPRHAHAHTAMRMRMWYAIFALEICMIFSTCASIGSENKLEHSPKATTTALGFWLWIVMRQ